VRTLEEARGVIDLMASCGLKKGVGGLKLVMMCEIPSNVLLIEQFAKQFDGFSIGSNDLTQLTLGVDRDSAILADLFDERDPAVMKLFEMAIAGAHAKKKFIGICGQAPSDYPEIAQFLISKGIDSISLNADSVIPFLLKSKKGG
jgi:pyruvate, water dikinase